MREQKGFTLLEMIVVITIMSSVSAILVAGFKNYGARLNLRSNANEVALAIREAQAFALAVRGVDHDSNSSTMMLYTSWGIHIDKSVSDTQIRTFVDTNPIAVGNKLYDSGQDSLVKTLNLKNGVKIQKLAKGLKSTEADNDALNRIDIIYQRPNPDTTLKADSTTCSGMVTPGTCPDLEIILQGTDGARKTVVVWSTGQVTVE